ncbi:hypothetical protein ACE10Z_34475 [Bradyrhizobium sp. Pha-3]|uniref:hypothetical protein n=1 Tax=Bradyrhizobium sp. Pha-3 TaxID=208375 RepID=UPI0035D3E6DF
MQPPFVVSCLNFILIPLTAGAATFWLRAAVAKVATRNKELGATHFMLGDASERSAAIDDVDMIATSRVQSKNNTVAASFACAAAVRPTLIYLLQWLTKGAMP